MSDTIVLFVISGAAAFVSDIARGFEIRNTSWFFAALAIVVFLAGLGHLG